jgi:hypothetical protein
MRFPIRFPVYALTAPDGVLAITVEGRECVLLFETRAAASAHLEHVQALGLSSLEVLKIPNAAELRDGLKSLPKEVTCALWDSGNSPHEFDYFRLTDLVRMLK